ncbi:hypothetical protein P3T17_004694 [Paraburkholderia sp. GAS82]
MSLKSHRMEYLSCAHLEGTEEDLPVAEFAVPVQFLEQIDDPLYRPDISHLAERVRMNLSLRGLITPFRANDEYP